MVEFMIDGDFIELFKLLKATKLCGTGGEAKTVIDEGRVTVDGEVETRLRRKIRPGMNVEYNGKRLAVRLP
ncbi:MAG: ribosome-associated protein [Verrucomicrobiota bacterium]|jgi:ribosome-associated protein|nr:ribosome-associated protein [Verrucomicrobiota bacterium]MDK2963655.1 ribosome-associated protein [Verrucomicrobiota bacterium]